MIFEILGRRRTSIFFLGARKTLSPLHVTTNSMQTNYEKNYGSDKLLKIVYIFVIFGHVI